MAMRQTRDSRPFAGLQMSNLTERENQGVPTIQGEKIE
jgi:hypothetical protein